MGVRAILEVETPFTEAQIFDVQYEQAADEMIFTHLDHHPRRLVRYAHDRWSFDLAVFASKSWPPGGLVAGANTPNQGTGYQASDISYVVTAIDASTGQESLPSAVATVANDLTLKGNHNGLAWQASAGAERYNVYKKSGGAWGYIGTTDTLGFTDDNIAPDFSQSYPRHKNPFPEAQDKPGSVAFWDQRAIYGRTYNKPNAIFASQSGNLYNFNASQPVVDSDAATFAVTGRRVNAILHLVPLKSLIAFTTDTIFSIRGSNGPFGPTSVEVTPEGYRAASKIRPVVIDDIIFYNTAKGGSIRTLGYAFEADGYKGNDLGVFSPHLFRNVTMRDLSYAEFPHSVLHCVASDGDVRCLTWQQEQDVWGWSLMATQGFIESVCTVSEEGEDRVYLVVNRRLEGAPGPTAGGWVRTVEYLASSRWVDVKDAIYLDSCIVYRGPPTDVITGLDHLNGRTVSVLADGAARRLAHVVEGGRVTLNRPASKVVVGLSYESWVRTLPPTYEARDGTTKGKPKTLAGFVVHVLKTRGIEVGQGKDLRPGEEILTGHDDPFVSDWEVEDNAYEPKTRNNEPMGQATALFSGELWAPLEAGNWKEASLVIRQRYPLPMHVTNIVADAITGG